MLIEVLVKKSMNFILKTFLISLTLGQIANLNGSNNLMAQVEKSTEESKQKTLPKSSSSSLIFSKIKDYFDFDQDIVKLGINLNFKTDKSFILKKPFLLKSKLNVNFCSIQVEQLFYNDISEDFNISELDSFSLASKIRNFDHPDQAFNFNIDAFKIRNVEKRNLPLFFSSSSGQAIKFPGVVINESKNIYFENETLRNNFYSNIIKLKEKCQKKIENVLGKALDRLSDVNKKRKNAGKSEISLTITPEDIVPVLGMKNADKYIFDLKMFDQFNPAIKEVEDEQCILDYTSEIINQLGEHKDLFKNFPIRKLVEVIKAFAPFSAQSMDLFRTYENFIKKNDLEFLNIVIMNQLKQDELISRIFFKKETTSFISFLDFLKSENDILWIIHKRTELHDVVDFKQNASDEKKSDGMTNGVSEKKANMGKFYQYYFDLSLLRIRVMLEKLKKEIPDWDKLIDQVTDESKSFSNHAYDFNHYGRYGIAGDLLLEFSGLDAKLLKNLKKLEALGENVPEEKLKMEKLSYIDHQRSLKYIIDYFEENGTNASVGELAFQIENINLTHLERNLFEEIILTKSVYEDINTIKAQALEKEKQK
jgi:hypothetical protein